MTDGNGILVVAGEASGDRAAARVVEELRRFGYARFFGLGGEAMERAGVRLIRRTDLLAAIGIRPAARRLGAWIDAWAALREEIVAASPRAALLVDSPELNLPLARVLTESGARVVQYVGPQVWAWRPWRLALLRARTHHVALVLPFEKPLYDGAGVPASFVGHPILDEPPSMPRGRVRGMLHVPGRAPLIALLPGSRSSEVEALGPAMIEAGLRLLRQGMCPVFAPAPGVADGMVLRARSVGCAALPGRVRARDLLGACDAAVAASGTVTLEAAVEGAPMAVVYKVGPLSWRIARRLVRVDRVALPNILAGRAIVPELLQDEVTGEALARTVAGLLEPAERARQRRELALVAAALGGAGAASRVARVVARAGGSTEEDGEEQGEG